MGVGQELHKNTLGTAWEYSRTGMGRALEFQRNSTGRIWEGSMGLPWEMPWYVRMASGSAPGTNHENTPGIASEYSRNGMGASTNVGVLCEYSGNA